MIQACSRDGGRQRETEMGGGGVRRIQRAHGIGEKKTVRRGNKKKKKREEGSGIDDNDDDDDDDWDNKLEVYIYSSELFTKEVNEGTAWSE